MTNLINALKGMVPQRIIDFIRFLKYPNNVIRGGPVTYNQDGLGTVHNSDFMNEKDFIESFNVGAKTGSWGQNPVNHWRVYVILWCANWAKPLEGDFVECGVNKGGHARSIINYINFKNIKKKFYLLDTFCGLPERYISEEEKKLGRTSGGYEECYENVKETFKDFNNVEIIRGTVPDTLSHVKAEKVSFLSLDMNNWKPEIAAGEFFWNKLVKGGVIVLDDYGYVGFHPQKHEWDKFALGKGVRILLLPTGQGLIFKP